MRDIREELEQEVSFWREMSHKCTDVKLPECLRMRQALLLVEIKLSQLEETKH